MPFSFPSQVMRFFLIAVLAALSSHPAAYAEQEMPLCAVPPVPTADQGPSQGAVAVYRETGAAAWYGKEFHGQKTASGEVFDMNGISAAHRTLPFGTMIRVTNLDNFKSITIKINDRRPFIKSRILELSYGAARKLGFVEQGTARAKIETVDMVNNAASYTVQAAMYTEEENANVLKYRLSRKFEMVSIVPLETNITQFFCVRVGSYASEERAEQIAEKLTLEGLEPIVLRKE